MYSKLLDFLKDKEFFIEAEAKPSRMRKFVDKYNSIYKENLSFNNDGMIILQEDANKWGLELRLYVYTRPPQNVYQLGFTHNEAYRDNFSYRLNDNDVVEFLFDRGCRIGLNEGVFDYE